MPHNLTVTVDDNLWKDMKKHSEIRWSAVMKDAARNKIKALDTLNRFAKKTTLSGKEIEDFAVSLGKKITKRR
ncbi:MAG: hypothetical protein V1740_08575 [Candidatus Woesearchaeota archaeon]